MGNPRLSEMGCAQSEEEKFEASAMKIVLQTDDSDEPQEISTYGEATVDYLFRCLGGHIYEYGELQGAAYYWSDPKLEFNGNVVSGESTLSAAGVEAGMTVKVLGVKDAMLKRPKRTDKDIYQAVRAWRECQRYGRKDAEIQYGHISSWDVSEVTSMESLFEDYSNFNEDLSAWDVSNVTNMEGMFSGCEEFNQDLSKWNVSAVTSMFQMFRLCTNFNQPLNTWNVSAVTNMQHMFCGAHAFNQPLDAWNVSAVTVMSCMFQGAESFNQESVNAWDLSKANTEEMFAEPRIGI